MYEVIWDDAAVDDLAVLWTAADSPTRANITTAAAQIDHALEREPLNTGESRPGDLRVHFELPLGVEFRVWPAERAVRVVHVWLVGRRRS